MYMGPREPVLYVNAVGETSWPRDWMNVAETSKKKLHSTYKRLLSPRAQGTGFSPLFGNVIGNQSRTQLDRA